MVWLARLGGGDGGRVATNLDRGVGIVLEIEPPDWGRVGAGTGSDDGVFGVVFVFIIGIIYPVVSHWVWGGGWLSEVEDNGFLDFAGSTVVHSVGAWAGLMGAILVGARLGKFGANGEVHAIPGHSMPLAALGTLILWFGWFGFNPGSTLALSGGGASLAALVAVNTTLAAGAVRTPRWLSRICVMARPTWV